MRITLKSLLAAGLLLGCGSHGWADLLPDLVPVAFEVPTVIRAPPNSPLKLTWAVTNQGAGPAVGVVEDVIYFSTQSNIDSSASALIFQNGKSPLAAGEMYWSTNQINLPVFKDGVYYLILRANAFQFISESNPTNNELAARFTFQSTPADLAPLDLVVTSTVSGPPYPLVSVVWGVTNQGSGFTYGYWSDTLYVSSNATFDSSAIIAGSQNESALIPVGGQYWRTNTFRMPVVQDGTYYLWFTTDQYNSLYEEQTNNNVLMKKVTFQIQPPDLAPLALLVSNTLNGPPNPTFTLVWGVTNQGTGIAIGNSTWNDRVYLSTDTNFDWSDWSIADAYPSGPLAPAEAYWHTNDVTLPVVDSGVYYLMFKSDAFDWIYESDESNNILVQPITITIQRPDLVPVTQFPSQVTGPPFPIVTLIYGATNQGAGPAFGSWNDYVFFATNAADAFQGLPFSSWYNNPLPPGGIYWQTNTVRVPAVRDGTYYLVVDAAHYSNLYESDRSNNTVTVPVTFHITPPDLAPLSLRVPTVITSPPNPQLTFAWGITNRGPGPAIGNSYWSDVVFFSRNSVWDNTATALNSSYESGPFNPGDSYWRTNVLGVPVVQSGTYYFFLRADANGNLVESDDNDNELAVPVTFTIQSSDLAPLVSQIQTNYTGPPNPAVALVWGITNQGIGLATSYPSAWYDAIYFSTNDVLDERDVDVGGWLLGGPLAPGDSYWHTNKVWLPVTQSGTYFLIFKADRNDFLYEDNKRNNVSVVPITVTVLPPDLAPLELRVPPVITGPPNPSVAVVWGVTNKGIGPAVMSSWAWSDVVYFSTDAALDEFRDISIGSQTESGPVAPGASYWRTNIVRLLAPSSTNAYLIFAADANNTIYESNEANNIITVPLTVNILPPDLAPVAFFVPNAVTSPPQPMLTFNWGVTNQGTGLAEASWNDQLYISTNQVWDSSTALWVGTWTESASIPAGASYWRTNTVTVPVVSSGTYYFFLVTDAWRSLYESDFGNNIASAPVDFTIQPADLAVLDFQAPATISAPPKPSATFVWAITNQGVGAALGNWSDWLYISTSPVFDYSALFVATSSESGPLEPGDSYWRTNSRTLPVTQSGKYYLFFQTDSGNPLYESDTSNNWASLPVTINILPPDLAPVAILVTNLVIGPPFPSVTIVWGVTNQGAGAVIPERSWWDQIAVCSDASSSFAGCTTFGSFTENITVAAGDTYWRTNTLRVPVVASGTYYLRFEADQDRTLYESSFTNNQITVPVTFHIRPPDLAPIVFQAPSAVTGSPNPQVKLSWGVTNQGLGTAIGNGPWLDAVYLSRTPILDNPVGLVWNWEMGPVAPGGNYWRSQIVRMPVTESGDYYLIFAADASRQLYDQNYSNNTAVVPVTFNIMPSDLAPITFLAPTNISALEVTNVTFVWAVTNQGTGPADPSLTGNWSDSIYLSTAPQGTWSDLPVLALWAEERLQPADSYWRTNTTKLPVVPSGNYYFVLRTDSNNSLTESDEDNNTSSTRVMINMELPDLAPVSLQFPKKLIGPPDPVFTLIYAVRNQGAGFALGQTWWLDQAYLSRTNVLDATANPLTWSYEQTPVPPGQAYWRTNVVQLPVPESGSYYLLLKTDASDSQQESDESNNVVAVPITFELQTSDVAALGLQFPDTLTASPNPKLLLSWGVTNQGPGEAATWNWRQALYVSTVGVLDSNAIFAMSFRPTNNLPVGGTAWFTNEVKLPLVTNGQYYLLVSVNADNFLYESVTNNDVAVAALTYSAVLPDLMPLALQAPQSLNGAPYPWVTLSWGITNQGLGAAAVAQQWWYPDNIRPDQILVSSSSNLDFTASSVLFSSETNSVAPGESYWRTNSVRLPVSESGTYYLFLSANSFQRIAESDFSNNVLAVPINITIKEPDLTPLVFEAPPLVAGPVYPETTVVWGVTNQGAGPAEVPYPPVGYNYPALVDALYISTTPTLDSYWVPPAAVWPRTEPILPGTSYIHTNTLQLQINNSGTYYLLFVTDAFRTAFESDELNNTAALAVDFRLSPPADLTVLSLIAPRVVTGAGNAAITVTWHVMNQGLGSTAGGWWDTISLFGSYLPEIPLGSFWAGEPLLAGDDYWRTNTIILPVTHSGDYLLTLRAGTGFGLFDLNFQDNVFSVPITVNITAPPVVRLANPQLRPNGVFELFVYGALGASYTLQGTLDLTNWSRVADFVCVTNPMRVNDPDAATQPSRFYRVVPLTNSPPVHLDIGAPRSWKHSGLRLKLDGPVGVLYQIQTSTNLLQWQQITNLPTVITPAYFEDSSAGDQQQTFYRAIMFPIGPMPADLMGRAP